MLVGRQTGMTRCFCRAQQTGTIQLPRSKAKHVSHVVTARRLRPCQHARAGWPSIATGEGYVHLSFIRNSGQNQIRLSFITIKRTGRESAHRQLAHPHTYQDATLARNKLVSQNNKTRLPDLNPRPSFFVWALCSSTCIDVHFWHFQLRVYRSPSEGNHLQTNQAINRLAARCWWLGKLKNLT